jgi:5-methylcytosine-specific restriction endonuclease McrA
MSVSSISSSSTADSPPSRASFRAQTAPARALVEPTSEARYRIQLNASASLKEKLELFQALVSHSVPNGDVAAVLERALDLALEQVEKQRFARIDKPRKPRRICASKLGHRGSRREHIPNAVQREVATRDGLRCTYVSEDGCRCSARAFLQIHHEHPWARGGAPVPENLRLLCAVHNRLLAERDFGATHVAQRLAARRGGDPRAKDAEVAASNVRREVSKGNVTLPDPE